MLITIYNNEAKDSFETTFKSNLILPKNCELKLTNAFIALAHRITIPADKTTFKITANDETATAHNVVITAGLYSLSALASEIQSKAQAVSDAQNLGLNIEVNYNNDNGYGINAITFDIDCLSLLANFFTELNFAVGEYEDFTTITDGVLTGDVDAVAKMNGSNNFLGVSKLESPAGADVASWAYVVSQEELVFHKWLQPDQIGSQHKPPSHPSSLNPYGAVSIQDNNNIENYWFGFSNGSTTFGGITTNNFDEIKNLDNCPIVVLVVKSAGIAGFPQNSVHIYEDAGNGGGLQEIGRKKSGFASNDKIGISIEDGSDVFYWYRSHNGSKWKPIPIKNGSPPRYTPATGDVMNFCYATYGANTDATTGKASMKKVFASLADDAHEKLNDFGQFVKWDWNGNGAQLGFDKATYEDEQTGQIKANLIFGNEKDVSVDGDSETETYKTAPYINLMIDNLPVNSYSDNNTDTLENELDMSKCVASIPRYDQNGRFSLGYNLMYNPVEANTIKLKNEHEINLSQLRFRLRQADGQIPKDLDKPMSFVFDFNGEK